MKQSISKCLVFVVLSVSLFIGHELKAQTDDMPDSFFIPSNVSIAISASDETLEFSLYWFQKQDGINLFSAYANGVQPSIRLVGLDGEYLYPDSVNVNTTDEHNTYRVNTLDLQFSTKELDLDTFYRFDTLQVYDLQSGDHIGYPVGMITFAKLAYERLDSLLTLEDESFVAVTSSPITYPYAISNASLEEIFDVRLVFVGIQETLLIESLPASGVVEGILEILNDLPIAYCKPVIEYRTGNTKRVLFLEPCQLGLLSINDATLDDALSYYLKEHQELKEEIAR